VFDRNWRWTYQDEETNIYYLSVHDPKPESGSKYHFSKIKWFEFGDKLCMCIKGRAYIHNQYYTWRVEENDVIPILLKEPAIKKEFLEWLIRHPELASCPKDDAERAQFRSEFEASQRKASQDARAYRYRCTYRNTPREKCMYTPLEDL